MKVIYELLRDTFNEWSADKAPRLGAALAYYSAFSLAPLVVIAIGIASLVFEKTAARGGIVQEIESTLGQPAAVAIEDMINKTNQSGESRVATWVGLAVLLFGASGVFVQLQDALNTIWKVTPKPDRTWWNLIRERFLSFGVVLATGFLLLVSLVISALLSAVAKYFASRALPGGVYLWQTVNIMVSVGFVTVLFALIYKLLPDATISWRDVWIGAFVTAVLFTVGKHLIGVYLGQSSTTSVFGAAGSLVVILIWVYYSAQLVLFGAEFTRVYANRFGSRVVPAENAMAVTDAMRAAEGMPCRQEPAHSS